MEKNASLLKRLLAMIYDLLILIAIWLLVVGLFLMIFGDAEASIKRFLLQLLLWLVAGAYFVHSWSKTGQTLALQAWKIKLVDANHQPVKLGKAVQRYCLACCSLLFFGLGFFWAVIDKQQLFLHDRLLGTRLISVATELS